MSKYILFGMYWNVHKQVSNLARSYKYPDPGGQGWKENHKVNIEKGKLILFIIALDLSHTPSSYPPL